MTAAFSQDDRQLLTEQMIERFTDRFGEAHRLLAYHAALPLVLTPELLNYLRTQFLYGQVPWEAEVDLLLSDLCRPVGYELYVMDTHVRALLLREMEKMPELGTERMQSVAKLLISYVRYLHQVNPAIRQQELQAQQWAAMVFLEDQQEAAAQQIAEAFHQAIAPDGTAQGQPLINAAEATWLAQLTQKLAPQLTQEPDLVRYAALVGQLLRSPQSITDPAQLAQSYQVGDRLLPPLTSLLPPSQLDEESDRLETPVEAIGENLGVTLKRFEFDEAEIVLSDRPSNEALEPLESFEFEVVTVNAQGAIVRREARQASYFVEPLAEGVPPLEMILITAGEFLMGSPVDEPGRYDDENSQHLVTVQTFCMSKYPITQAQWRSLAGESQVNRELVADPANFQGDDRPVERVSWYDAVEWCDRLSRFTGRVYQLPSEAQWEYACRAGTTTPFYFGETITTELANYDGSVYRDEAKGKSRNGTTSVGSFPPNAFGLYDMHGNVREWCLDHWHDSYKGAPDDGSAWLSDNEKSSRVLRGGSWIGHPWYCRSASRYHNVPDLRDLYSGFRVVCLPSRILP